MESRWKVDGRSMEGRGRSMESRWEVDGDQQKVDERSMESQWKVDGKSMEGRWKVNTIEGPWKVDEKTNVLFHSRACFFQTGDPHETLYFTIRKLLFRFFQF